MTLGEIIKEYRTGSGVSQDVIADRSGLSKSYISILERNRNPKTGEPPIPSLKSINLIAQAIGCDFDEIFAKLDPDLKISIGEQLPNPAQMRAVLKVRKRIFQSDKGSRLYMCIDSELLRLVEVLAREDGLPVEDEIEALLNAMVELRIEEDIERADIQ